MNPDLEKTHSDKTNKGDHFQVAFVGFSVFCSFRSMST